MALLSRRVRYALHGLGYVGTMPPGEPVPFHRVLDFLRSYSHRLTLSSGYIAKIFQEVSRAGFAVAIPGPRGGYQLARPASKIRLIDVVEVLEGPLVADCCLLAVGTCDVQETCGFRTVMQKAESAFYNALAKETVASLVRRMDIPAQQAPKARKKPAARTGARGASRA